MTTHAPEFYHSTVKPSWCGGCSYFSLFHSLTGIFTDRQIAPDKISVISGIGCSSRIPLYFSTFGMHTLHGRALPVAAGCRLVRPDIPVVVIAGDGDLFSIGAGHFVSTARKNFNMTVICLDNRMYAMTKNQVSPTSPEKCTGTLTPFGNLNVPLNVIEFAIACNATLVSRSFTGAPDHLRKTLCRAFDHQGFSFVHIIAPCRTFGDKAEAASFQSRMVDINDELHFDPKNRPAAFAAAAESIDFYASDETKMPVGVFYEKNAPTFEGKVAEFMSSADKERSLSAIIDEFAV